MNTSNPLARFNCGPVKFSGDGDALYERHLTFDQVIPVQAATLRDFLSQRWLGNVQRVEVLPFHQMGRFKWEKLGMAYALKDTVRPSPEGIQKAVAVFREAGLQAV